MKLVSEGDSITYGYPVTAAQNYCRLIANNISTSSNISVDLLDYGVSGRMAADQTWNIKTNQVGDINTIMLGVNDTNWANSNTDAKKDVYKGAMRTLMLNYSGNQVVKAVNMTRSSGFTAFTGAYDTWGIVSSTANDTAQTTVYGTSVYVGYIFKTDETGGQFDVIIDNVVKETVTTLGTVVGDTPSGINLVIMTKRYDGLTEGPHVVKVINKITGKKVYLQYVCGNSRQLFKKPLFVGNTIKKVNYITAGDNDANVADYCAIVQDLVNEFQADKYQVYYVDVNSVLNTSTDYYDNVHPNVVGHSKMATAFNSQILSVINGTMASSIGGGSGPCTPVPCAPLNGHVIYGPATRSVDVLYNNGAVTSITIT